MSKRAREDEVATILVTGGSGLVGKGIEATINRAADNLAVKVDFLQKMSAPKAIATRLAEAAHGSKWTAATPADSKLAELQARFPEFGAAFEELGLTASMDSVAMNAYLKESLVCDKKAAKAVLARIAEGDMEGAAAKMGNKPCITL